MNTIQITIKFKSDIDDIVIDNDLNNWAYHGNVLYIETVNGDQSDTRFYQLSDIELINEVHNT